MSAGEEPFESPHVLRDGLEAPRIGSGVWLQLSQRRVQSRLDHRRRYCVRSALLQSEVDGRMKNVKGGRGVDLHA